MVEYNRASVYLATKTSDKAKITAIDAIINTLLASAADAASNEGIEEYWLDDGQTKIKTVYRDSESIYKGIVAFQRLRQIYVNRVNGRTSRNVPSKAFPLNRCR